jgi:hypothetical protein
MKEHLMHLANISVDGNIQIQSKLPLYLSANGSVETINEPFLNLKVPFKSDLKWLLDEDNYLQRDHLRNENFSQLLQSLHNILDIIDKFASLKLSSRLSFSGKINLNYKLYHDDCESQQTLKDKSNYVISFNSSNDIKELIKFLIKLAPQTKPGTMCIYFGTFPTPVYLEPIVTTKEKNRF